jgi:hypothetical protein
MFGLPLTRVDTGVSGLERALAALIADSAAASVEAIPAEAGR